MTVPAYFTDKQKRAMVEACKFAGLPHENVELIREPRAALTAFGLSPLLTKNEKFSLVIRIGGTSYEISLLKTKSFKSSIVESEMDLLLGGRLIEEKLTDMAIAARLPQASSLQPSQKFRLVEKICRAKHELFDSNAEQV